MKLEEIEKVIALFEKADISSLEVEDGGFKIKLTKEMTPVSVTKVIPSAPVSNPILNDKEEEDSDHLAPGEEYIKSPLVGTYHQAPFSDGKAFVEVGSNVKKGDKLCIIEAMKVMNEITAPKDGVIKKILAVEGAMIEYDQELFVIGE